MHKVYDEVMTIGRQFVARCDFCDKVFTWGKITGYGDPQTREEAEKIFMRMGLRKVEHDGCVGDMCEECREVNFSENED